MTNQTPLTEADYREINKGLGHITNTREVLERAKRAGVDMDEPLAALDVWQYQLESLKREFFPERT